jgi:membrane associated rhomboid family serine protease
MFPIRDEIPSRHAPLVTWALVLTNLAVFVWQLTLSEEAVRELFYLRGMVPARLSDGAWAARVGFPDRGALSFATSMFLHGGLLHVAANVWSLWIFGDNVEDRMGKVRFLAFYLACGLAAGLLHWWSNPASIVPTIGASGAIAGVLGAYLRWYPTARVLTLIPIFIYPLFIELPAVVFLGFWFLTQVASGVLSIGMPDEVAGVAWWAHIGGFVTGMLLCGLFRRRSTRQRPGPVRHFVLPNAVVRNRSR